MYEMVFTRPDIGHAVGVLSRYMSNQGKFHWEAVKWILRYLRGTMDKCLYFGKGKLKVQDYVDADFGGEVDNRKCNNKLYIYSWKHRSKLDVLTTKDYCFVHYRSRVCGND